MINLTDIRDINGDTPHPNNSSLRIKTGRKEYTIAVYTVDKPRRFLYHQKVTGTIHYPFAVRKVETDDGGSGYCVDHLPTGWKVTVYVLRKDGVNAIKKLLKENRNGIFSKTSFTDGNYKKLQKAFGD